MSPSTKSVVGGALLAAGAASVVGALHDLVSTGSCSSTGYLDDGTPVPLCPPGTGWDVLLMVLGIIALLAGGAALLAAAAPAPVFIAVGLGALTAGVGPWATAGVDVWFSALFGGSFLVAGLVWLVLAVPALRGVVRRRPASRPVPREVQEEPEAAAPTYLQPPGGAAPTPDP